MCYSVPYHKGFARGMRDTITIDTECTCVLTDLDPTFHWLPQARSVSIKAASLSNSFIFENVLF